ncbi:MAG: hypothetical protein B6D44_10490 [Ignavibacteriales bacterium UTCHB2]|jgi:hypothetical protein|nr:MAG: hypothetical protein B6D44_10490 [Ignavibacteriales bacterium UTCHB2]
MKKNFTFCIFIGLLFCEFFISSCSKEVTENKKIVPSLNYFEAFSIYQNKYLIKPDTIYISNSNQYFAGEDTDNMIVLKSFGNTWQEQYRFDKFSGRRMHEVDWTEIDSIPYIYFVNEDAGNATGSVTFYLTSLADIEDNYSISFYGAIGKYDVMANPPSQKLKSQPKLLSYLEGKISKSNAIYRPSPEDLDINNPKNCERKWLVENQYIYENAKHSSERSLAINFIFYDENLFTDIGHGSEISSVENELYIVKSFFKDNVISFDKKRTQYFVVWVPEFPHDCIQEIEFESSSVIVLKNDFEEYKIDLVNARLNCLKYKDF